MDVALSFWGSRTEKSAARLEDIVTTALIATLSSITAGIIVEMWKGELGLLKRLFSEKDKESLRKISRKEPQLRKDFDGLLPFYYAKANGKGVADPLIAARLYDEVGRGVTFLAFSQTNREAVQHEPGSHLLSYAAQVSRGVILTELRCVEGFPLAQYHSEKTGLPLSPYFAFGEAIPLFPVADLGIGPNWSELLKEKLASNRLYPDFWPSGVSQSLPSPKILILDDAVFERLRKLEGHAGLIAKCGGIISTNSNMNSHLGVLSRGIGIGAMTCPTFRRRTCYYKVRAFSGWPPRGL